MNHVSTLRLEGELTIYCAQETRQQLQQALAGMDTHAAPTLEIDLSGVVEADTAGMQLLLAARRQAQALGGEVALKDCSPAVAEVMALLGLAPYFDAQGAAGQIFGQEAS